MKMNDIPNLQIVARIRTDFPTKFGIPRQSLRVNELYARIEMQPPFDDRNALRGIEQFSHLWLLWLFSENMDAPWSPTVRPPRLGGNTRLGVFATRSPFRPSPVGLSCVRLLRVEEEAPALIVSGADLMDLTPIIDIKPYLKSDAVRDASGGFADAHQDDRLAVVFPPHLEALVPESKRAALWGVLQDDPRPAYQTDGRRYGFFFAGMEIFFMVEGSTLTVTDIKTV